MEFLIIGLFALMLGSFLNVVIYRLPKLESIVLPASHCKDCKHALHIWHNIPVIGFLWLKGKCFFCKKPISWRYPLVEILTVILSLIALFQFGWQILLLPVLLFTYALITLTFIDIDEQILPDIITIPLLGLGLLFNSFYYFTTPVEAIWGMLLGFTVLFIIDYIYFLLRKRHGIGMGDCKLLAAIGAWLGISAIVPVILIASLLGLLCALLFMLLKRLDYNAPIAFGPFLAIAAWGYLICG